MIENNSKNMSKFNAWILATRPRTLPAAIAPVMLGSAMAIADKNFVGLRDC
jgi:1,4-dihydroxy-2-naphthoate octaprenyltransferase